MHHMISRFISHYIDGHDETETLSSTIKMSKNGSLGYSRFMHMQQTRSHAYPKSST